MSYSSTSDNFLQIPNTTLIELNLETTRFQNNSVGYPDDPRHNIDSMANGALFDYQVFQSNSEQPKIIGTRNHKYTDRGGQARFLRGSVINEPDKFYILDTDYIISPETAGQGLRPDYYYGFNNYPSAFNIVLANPNYDKETNGAMDKYVHAPSGSYATRFTPGWFRANVGVNGATRYNPIVEVGLFASRDVLGEGGLSWVFKKSGAPYEGLYHLHLDGTAMIGEGVLNTNHEINPDEVIISGTYEDFDPEQINEEILDEKLVYTTPPSNILSVREKVSDLFYKIWFESNTLSDNELLSLQTTIRDGKKQSGRTEDEPLVFYKKDRNTLENRKDIVGDKFEQMCQYIFNQEITELENYLQLTSVDLPSENENDVVQYKIIFNHGRTTFDIDVAKKIGDTFTDILNLSQLTKPKFGNKIDPEKAREILDTNIFELLPNQTTRQDQINDFFSEFDNLIGPTPIFQDVDGDGVGEDIQNYEVDEQSRISYENKSNAFITRLDEQSEGSSVNQSKTLESMRNRLNTYLGDVDNIIETLEDDRPDYQNVSSGFLKIRKPNQAIIIRAPGNDLLEFQKGNSYLTDGFTITMWVRFVSKTSEGTLFNFGNPLEENGSGFRLETRTNIDGADNYKRWIRLAVRDVNGTLRDNHWGVEERARRIDGQSSPIGFYSDEVIHQLYPNIPTENLDEWYFICATYNPSVVEEGSDQRFNKQYWLNHVNGNNEIVAYSGLGAKCKVEVISRSDLLRARGFKVDDLTITAEEDTSTTTVENNPPVVNFSFTILTSTEDTGERGGDNEPPIQQEDESTSTITIESGGGY